MRHYAILSALLLLTFQTKGSLSQVCGRAPLNPIIVGGTDAPPGSWPWQVYLEIPGLLGRYMCGGSLINQQWILTAAHCLHGKFGMSTDVYLGSVSLSDTNIVKRRVTRVQIHKSYSPSTLENDIALLKMSSPITFSDYIQPVCLAEKGSTFYTGVMTWVAGWGTKSEGGTTSSLLQQVSLPVVGDNECKCKNSLSIPPKTMCTGYAQGGKDTCQGDSGGPLVVKNDTAWIQTGIVSFGEGCARPNIPGVYTDVSEFQDWIQSIVGSVDPPGFVKFTSPGEDSDKTYTCLVTTAPPTTTAAAADGTTTMATTIICLSLITLNLW